jgi:type I restriction enzyme M protein
MIDCGPETHALELMVVAARADLVRPTDIVTAMDMHDCDSLTLAQLGPADLAQQGAGRGFVDIGAPQAAQRPCGSGHDELGNSPRASCGAPTSRARLSAGSSRTASMDGAHMSEDLVSRHARTIGRLSYLSLGSTTLAQLKKSKFIRGSLSVEEERRKPDGIVFLPLGGIKAVIEAKVPKELTAAKLPKVVQDYSPIARAVCKLLIVTDGKNTYWYNAITQRPVLDEQGSEVRFHINLTAIDDQALSPEDEAKLVALVEKADYSLSDSNDRFSEPKIVDPSGLARSVWQKIWINTGKEPEKCLYNVVEILVFKFLSDIGVLTGNNSFRRIVELLANEGPSQALNHYGRVCRSDIRRLFPAGADGTTIINGTIFVNEAGEPNLAQAGLFGEVIRAFQDYDDQNGSLRYIDRQFKTRLYESFLRQQAGIKSLGQYFTPRNVVQAIVRMSNAGALIDGQSMCDPFCGVGGFLLEAIAENPNLSKQFEPKNGLVNPAITIKGYDKGTDEKDDERTIILAKANMLVYLSDLLAQYHSPDYLKQFSAHAFNEVFHLIRSNLGTFGRVDPSELYDLILTNPPYVTSGSASLRSAIEYENLSAYYSQGGRGTEALAIQWIVNHLKPNGQAFVVVPDGLMNQETMLGFIKSHCEVLAVVALPSRTFYSTPKKTYVLGLLKKSTPGQVQHSPVFTYLVSEIGESRDTRRVVIDDNDLTTMEREFRYFRADPTSYASADPRCKLVGWTEFDGLRNWLVDRTWTREEKVDLGIVDEAFEVDPEAFRDLILEARRSLDDLLAELT